MINQTSAVGTVEEVDGASGKVHGFREGMWYIRSKSELFRKEVVLGSTDARKYQLWELGKEGGLVLGLGK